MDLVTLKQRAEKAVSLEFDAWATFTGAERTALIYKKMLALLEKDNQDLLRSTLLVARDVWETGAWAWGGHQSFVEFLCDVGGRYRQEDGRPSGVSYDMANYVTTVWPVLEAAGYNPLEIAARGWTKARLMVSTVRSSVKMLAEGKEVDRPEEAKTIVVKEEAASQVDDVIRMATDETVSVRDMMHAVCERRIEPFKWSAALQKDGTWNIAAVGLTERQFNLVQRLLDRYSEVHLI